MAVNRVEDARHLGSAEGLRLRSATSTYAVFAVMFGVVMLFVVRAVLAHPEAFWSGGWQFLALPIAALCGFILYFGYLQVTVSQGVLTYRTLFGARSVLLSDIERSTIQWNIGGRDPRPFLVITSTSGGDQLKLNLKPFRREDIRQLLATPELKFHKGDDVA